MRFWPAASQRGGRGGGFLVVNNFSAFIFHLHALLNRLLITPLPDAGLETSEKPSEKLYFCRSVQRGVLPSAFFWGGFFPLTFNYFLRVTPVPQKNDQDRLSFADRRSRRSPSRSGRGSPGRPKPCPAASHARPRPRDPRHRGWLSRTGEDFVTPRRGGTPHSAPPARGWRPKYPQNLPVFFPTSPGRPGGFSQGDPSTFAFPTARSLLPRYLSFREAEAVCQLFSLCSYYIMVLLKGMFQSQ